MIVLDFLFFLLGLIAYAGLVALLSLAGIFVRNRPARLVIAAMVLASLVAPLGCVALTMNFTFTFNEREVWSMPRFESKPAAFGVCWLLTFLAVLGGGFIAARISSSKSASDRLDAGRG